jgi:hypothetical protein
MAVAALEPFGLTAERAGVARVRHAHSRLHCHWHFDRVYACGGGESYAARQVVTTAAGSGGWSRLSNHLIGTEDKRLGKADAERICCLEI